MPPKAPKEGKGTLIFQQNMKTFVKIFCEGGKGGDTKPKEPKGDGGKKGGGKGKEGGKKGK